MKDNSYITLQDWMVDIYKLNGNELVIYGIIHGFSQDGVSNFSGEIEYLCKRSGASKRCVQNVLDKLIEKGLIVKKETKSCVYRLEDGTEIVHKSQGGAHHFCIYYTSISRNKELYDSIETIQNERTTESHKREKSKRYVVILSWMVDVLHLSSNELVIYAIIHGFSQDGISDFFGTIDFLHSLCGASNSCCKESLKKLVEKKFLIKHEVKEHIIIGNNGKKYIKKAQGGANYICVYCTAISRDESILNELLKAEEIELASTEASCDVPNAVLTIGMVNPCTKIAIGVPSADSVLGKYTPNVKIAIGNSEEVHKNTVPNAQSVYEPKANSVSVPSADSVHNNKTNNKIKTTTTSDNNEWNFDKLDYLLDIVFGSSGFFQNSFKTNLSDFLNAKKLSLNVGKKYLEYGFIKSKEKSTRDFFGYFASIIIKDSFYAQFTFQYKDEDINTEEPVNFVVKESETKRYILCPICSYSYDKNLYECPNCHFETSDLDNKKLVSIKKQLWNMPNDTRTKIETEIRNIGLSVLDTNLRKIHLQPKVNLDDSIASLEAKQDEIYKSYGLIWEEN